MNIKIISCILLQLEDIWGTQAPGCCSWLCLETPRYLWVQFSWEAAVNTGRGIKTRPMMTLWSLLHYRYCRQHQHPPPDWLEVTGATSRDTAPPPDWPPPAWDITQLLLSSPLCLSFLLSLKWSLSSLPSLHYGVPATVLPSSQCSVRWSVWSTSAARPLPPLRCQYISTFKIMFHFYWKTYLSTLSL